MCKFPNGDFAPFGATKGEAPWSPKAKSRFESSIEAQERELAVVPGDALGDHVGFLLALL